MRLMLTVMLCALAGVAGATEESVLGTQPEAAGTLAPEAPVAGADAISIPRMLSYQGKLTDTLGVPVPDTAWSVRFRLYTQPTGGTHYWQETQTVRTDEGLFSALLGSVTPISSVPDAGNLYLGMRVGADPEMAPRVRIVSSAYAFTSDDARHADTADYALSGGGGGSVTSVSQSTGINCTPNPITTTGTVALNRNYTDNRYVNANGDSMSGRLSIGAQLRTYDKAALGYSCYNNGFAAFCAGYGNSAGGDRSSITGGEDNTSGGVFSHVGGGTENRASGRWAAIGGGYANEASDTAATVSGGQDNSAGAPYAVVCGGEGNRALGLWSFIGGGYNNSADTNRATVCGGQGNRAGGVHAAIGGGSSNTTNGTSATVGGGFGNDASACATVGGGGNNDATGDYATIGGGQINRATELCATVIGGQGNDALGSFSVILGGRSNCARGYLSLAAGTHAHSNHNACFVWGDSTLSLWDSVYTTGSNQFRVRARGGTWFFSNRAMTTGAYLASGSNSWASVCDSATKEDFRDVDRRALLEKVARLSVRDYRMKDQDDGTRHIGPVAQDFSAAFGYGETNIGINLADADGVALAAIQALYEQNQSLARRVAELESRLGDR
ncbi:MAG: tail fiber domain-containing protein [candidate division WOR-3 bacterium]|nr:MAG: tail fiber domain-containing protein [candidate division WOR-3 bacterium]